jgi:protein phosphatase
MREDLVLKSFGMSDVGLVRKHNEDYYAIDETQGLFIVADGLGGHEGGEIASKLATETIVEFFKEIPKKNLDDSSIDGKINEAIQKAHQAILNLFHQDKSLKGMGTTIVLALFKPPHSFYIANIGDSRAYLFRNQKMELITQDHSVVAQLVQQGKITPDEARTHRLRNIVTQAIGIDLNMGCYKRKISAKDEDTIILCSDGLWDMLSDETIKEICFKEREPKQLCSNLIESAKQAGGRDNITVVIISVKKRQKSLVVEALAQVQKG